MTLWPTLAKSGVSAALLVSGFCFYTSGQAASETWRINDIAPNARVHLREEPSNGSDVIAYIPGDTGGLNGGTCAGNWCPVEFRGLKGWVFKDYLEPDDEPQQQAQVQTQPQQEAQPQSIAAPASTLPEELEQRKSFRLTGNAGTAIPVYVFPSETMPVAGHLPERTESVEGLGSCVPNWCYVRSGALIGWIKVEVIALDDAPANVQATASIAPMPPAHVDERNMLNKTVPTATNANAPAPAPALDQALPQTANGGKSYALAGLSGKSSLPIRAEPEETSRILEWIPGDARNVEGLRKCVEQWCLVRYGSTEGWVARRHLADASAAQTQTFQVSGLPLWDPLKVFDQPAGDANVVGEIPSYATGIVPIGGCDRNWCHIRYLGVAGWVNSQNLEPQKR